MPTRSARKLKRVSEIGARRVLKLSADSAAAIAARTPLMADPGSASNRNEITRMVMEKPPAFADAAARWMGKGPSLFIPLQRFVNAQLKLNNALSAQALAAGNPVSLAAAQHAWVMDSSKLSMRLGMEFSARSVSNFNSSLTPIERKASANARRLGPKHSPS